MEMSLLSISSFVCLVGASIEAKLFRETLYMTFSYQKSVKPTLIRATVILIGFIPVFLVTKKAALATF